MSEVKGIKGYKVFNPDWTCRPNGKCFQYEVGRTYEENVTPAVCESGFHFCEKAADCFNYYRFTPENKVAEVVALGDIDSDGVKSCTNKIKITREIPWPELLKIVNIGGENTGNRNTGNRNTGNCNTGNRNTSDWNTGNCNTGNCNTGNRNTGNCNTGNCNTGDWNTGNCNTGNCNTGNCNTGNRNTGNWNTGNWNTGDWNECNFSNGCFNTCDPKIFLFNKLSNWTYQVWANSNARRILGRMPKSSLEWIRFDEMTDGDKEKFPDAKTVGGYLKFVDRSKDAERWWSSIGESERAVIKSIPNFDRDIFKEITGIDAV